MPGRYKHKHHLNCMRAWSARMITQQARVIDPLMDQCWASFYDAGTTLTQQWLNASCLLGTKLRVP